MNKNFFKSLLVAIISLGLLSSCSYFGKKCHKTCDKNKAKAEATTSSEATKSDASKAEVKAEKKAKKAKKAKAQKAEEMKEEKKN